MNTALPHPSNDLASNNKQKNHHQKTRWPLRLDNKQNNSSRQLAVRFSRSTVSE
jgi:hypothetical protein